jgi:hypothetical protein
VRFQVDRTDAVAIFAIEDSDTVNRRFGLIANGDRLYVQYTTDGSNWVYPLDLVEDLALDTWYVLQIAVDDEHGFSLEVYQESDPSIQGALHSFWPPAPTWPAARFGHPQHRCVRLAQWTS